MGYMSTNFGADSSIRFPITALKNKQKNKQINATKRPTHAGGYTAGVSSAYSHILCQNKVVTSEVEAASTDVSLNKK